MSNPDRVADLERRLEDIAGRLERAGTKNAVREIVTNLAAVALVGIAGWAIKISSDVSLLRVQSSNQVTAENLLQLESRLRRDFDERFPQPWLKEALIRLEGKVDAQSSKISSVDSRLTRLEGAVGK